MSECNCSILETIPGEPEYARCPNCHILWHLENEEWVPVTIDLDDELGGDEDKTF